MKLQFFRVREPEALDSAFKRARRAAQAVLVLADPLTVHHKRQITALAAKYRLPGMYALLDFVDSGGLMAYGVDTTVLFRRAADYVDKILKGARPADLPIEQPTQFALAINLKTAKGAGIDDPRVHPAARRRSDSVSRLRLSFAIALGCIALAVAAVGTPFARSAEPAKSVAHVGFVHPQSPSTATRGVNAFWERLRELGWVEGQNLVIEARWAEGRYDRLPALMAEVLGRKVDVLVTYGTQTAVAAENATSTIPIISVAIGEPLRVGLTTSLARPSGNLSGLSAGWTEGLAGKWLELLQETVPRLSHVAVISNPDNPIARALAKELGVIAPKRGLKLWLIAVREPRALGRAFEQAAQKAQAVLVLPDAVISAHSSQVTALAAKHRLPAMYPLRDFVDAGGLMGYAPDLTIQWRRGAEYVDKILRGAKPADLPIEQPTQYVFLVNLKTARALGLTFPESILLRADEVIR